MKTTRALAVFSVLLLATLVVFTTIIAVAQNGSNEKSVNMSDALTYDTIEGIRQDIYNRVLWIKTHIDNQLHENYYEGGNAIYQYVTQGVEGDSLATYFFYYNEAGKLIYAEIAHYRAALYSIYFHNNKLLHVEVGSFSYVGESFINGGLAEVEIVIAEDPSYAFVLEDIAFCLQMSKCQRDGFLNVSTQ